MLTAHDVLNATFTATKFREGYDVEQVDDYLDRVAAALEAYEKGTPATGLFTSQQARDVRFSATKWREGYEVTEVDDLIDSIVSALTSYEAGPRATPQTPAPVRDAVGPQDAPAVDHRTSDPDAKPLGIHDLTTQLQYARIRASASDRLTVLLPDGSTAFVTALDAGPDGITLRTTR